MFPLYDLNPHRRFPLLTVVIIAINAGVTLLMSGLSDQQANLIAFRHGFVPIRASNVSSGKILLLPVPDVNPRGQLVIVGTVQLSTSAAAVYSTFLSTMFLHGGWGHMFSNMWILWIFGNNIEDRLGHALYLVYYLIGGVAATLCHWAVNSQSDLPVVGASGAVAAVLGGYALTFPWAKIRTLIILIVLPVFVDVPALAWLGIWFIGQNVIPALFSMHGVAQDPIAYWAHIGGFLAGALLMPIFSLVAPPPPQPTEARPVADDMFHFNDPRMRMR